MALICTLHLAPYTLLVCVYGTDLHLTHLYVPSIAQTKPQSRQFILSLVSFILRRHSAQPRSTYNNSSYNRERQAPPEEASSINNINNWRKRLNSSTSTTMGYATENYLRIKYRILPLMHPIISTLSSYVHLV